MCRGLQVQRLPRGPAAPAAIVVSGGNCWSKQARGDVLRFRSKNNKKAWMLWIHANVK